MGLYRASRGSGSDLDRRGLYLGVAQIDLEIPGDSAAPAARIYMVGRYRWIFQGIADSIKDGFYAGASFRGD